MRPKQVNFVFESYKLLERKLIKTLVFLPFSKENEKAWSPELVSLFIEVGSLLDSLSRTLLGGNRNLTINHFETKLFKPVNLLDSNIVVYTYPLTTIAPFQNYRNKKFGWWFVYNQLKHNRVNHYEKANLLNALRALGGLFLILTRHSDEEFSKALYRRQWTTANGIVPEYVHQERLDHPDVFWCDSALFGGSENHQFVPKNLDSINPALTSAKFQRYFGRYNP